MITRAGKILQVEFVARIGPVGRVERMFFALVAAIRRWAEKNGSHNFIHSSAGNSLSATTRLIKAVSGKLIKSAV